MAKVKTKTQYGCSGSCGGIVSEDDFRNGKRTCGDEDCDRYGQPLEKMEHCPGCGQDFLPQDADEHETCS
jgi:hypothetical protein